jgi:hypothetical protein
MEFEKREKKSRKQKKKRKRPYLGRRSSIRPIPDFSPHARAAQLDPACAGSLAPRVSFSSRTPAIRLPRGTGLSGSSSPRYARCVSRSPAATASPYLLRTIRKLRSRSAAQHPASPISVDPTNSSARASLFYFWHRHSTTALVQPRPTTTRCRL